MIYLRMTQVTRLNNGILCAAVFFCGTVLTGKPAIAGDHLRVGIYQNPPKIFRDDGGRPSGFWPELIGSIGQNLGQEIEYVDCVWATCLEMLEAGALDVMPDVAYSEDRAQRFRFANHPVLYSWSLILVADDTNVRELRDLAQIRVAVVENSIQEAELQKIFAAAPADGEIITVGNMEETIARLRAGRADAAIVNRFFARVQTRDVAIRALDLPFRVSSVQFAFAPNAPESLVAAFDLEIFRQRSDPGSVIFSAEHRWILEEHHAVPLWLTNLLYAGSAMIFLSLAFIVAMRRTIRRRTQKLADAVASLESEMVQRKQAEAAVVKAHKMEAMGRLVGGVAHDFNNLLAVILGNLELSQREQTSTKVQQFLDDAMTATMRGSELVKQLLSFGRRANLAPENVDLGETLPQFERLLRTSLPATIDIQIEIAPDVRPIKVDRAQLETALLNLAFNARDAMPNGGTLSISVNSIGRLADVDQASFEPIRSSEYVQIVVKDTGVGMDEEVLEKVFEPFFTTKPVGEGAGLGLAMVHGFVKQSDGAISIDSTLGSGPIDVRLAA